MVTNQYFTLVVNYDNGEIEVWLEKEDSWKLQLAEGEKIDKVYASYEIHEDKIQGNVFTSDLDGNTHMYWLLPNEKVEKIQ